MNYKAKMCGLVVGGLLLNASIALCQEGDDTKRVYFAGELFDVKHLVGNAMLAEAIKNLSEGRYVCQLPQNLEQRLDTDHAIRDADIKEVTASDVALFNYDGTELDSGTVVEYLCAKFADIPTVILRTDMRTGGEHSAYPWNLMTSNFPRTEVVIINAMQLYKEALAQRLDSRDRSSSSALATVDDIAKHVIVAMDKVVQTKPRMPQEIQEGVHQWLARFPGFKDSQEEEDVLKILQRKRASKEIQDEDEVLKSLQRKMGDLSTSSE